MTPTRPSLRSTYRVQLHRGFTFDDAAVVADYLARLGISHLYCSPITRAAPGSTHGYDVADYHSVNPELGGSEGFRVMVEALHHAGMGTVVDIVPNHMAASAKDNPWWWDVLRNGRNSTYAHYFDIDWAGPEDKILLPVLGDRYGVVLGAGELALSRRGEEPAISYYDHLFPAAAGSLEGLSASDVQSDPAAMHRLLERQHYRLAYWRTDRELNYRRFFDVNELIALRMDQADVFDDAHALVLSLVSKGAIDVLRIDHVDGLADPARYLERLSASAGVPVYVEKILAADETIPEPWSCAGTTGYEFAGLVTALFVDPASEAQLTGLYAGFTGTDEPLDDIVWRSKTMAMDDLLSADLSRLTDLFAAVCDSEPAYRDFTKQETTAVLRGFIAGLGVYRTYVDPRDDGVRAEDLRRIEAAAAVAEKRASGDPLLLRFLVDLMCLRFRSAAASELVTRLQQTSGPVMAKAVEDTTFYLYNRFVALNEVGSDPGRFGASVADLHRHNSWIQARRPGSLLASSTHDTKRGEDVRARLAVLSEIPARWSETVWRWAAANEKHRTETAPDRNTEYLLYQTLVGSWPLDRGRVVDYMRKATKEAKDQTTWVDPDEGFDVALESFLTKVLEDQDFVGEVDAFVASIATTGWRNSLAATLLKLTSPGVPDIYQGSELWNLSLVDPDNRRPVDYEARRKLLTEVHDMTAREAWDRRDEGAPKMLLTVRALELRARHPEAFGATGSYLPITASGPQTDHVVAFVRGQKVATVVPRLSHDLAWDDATTLTLPEGTWRDAITGAPRAGRQPVGAILDAFPVALLERT